MDWKFWFSLVVSFIGSLYQVLGYYQVKRSTGEQGALTMNVRRHYVATGIMMLLAWGAVAFDYRDRHFSSQSVIPESLSLLGYDRALAAKSVREGLEQEIKQTSHVWFAAIAGAHLPQLTPEARKKIDRLLLNDPDSQYMKILSGIQLHRGKDFPEDARRSVRLCKNEKIAVKVSGAPFLNVVLFDPGTPRAWARVQEFMPYFLGQQSVVYAVRKEEWPELYDRIESSFTQTWENGKDPEKIH